MKRLLFIGGFIIGAIIAGALSAQAASIFQVFQGGTGWGAFQAGAVPYGNGTGALSTTSAATNGQILAWLNGVPTPTATTTFSTGLTYSAGNVICNTASGSVFGCLSSADWGTFNGKENVLSFNYPLSRSTNTISFSGLSTTSPWTQSQLAYVVNNNTLTSVATGTLGSSGLVAVTAGQSVIGSGATISLSNINAGFVVGNNTGSAAAPTSFATSSLFGTGTGGQILAWNNGVPQWVGTTTFSAPLSYSAGAVSCPTCVLTTRAITLNGTANQITSSAGSQDLSADRTWTFSIPALFRIQQASTTDFSANTLAVGGTATTSINASGVLKIGSITGSTQCLHVDTNGTVTGTGSECGTGAGGVTSVATTYPLQTTGATGAITLSTAFGTTTANIFNAYNTFTSLFATLSTSTNATTTGSQYLTGVGSAGGLGIDSTGKVYSGATSTLSTISGSLALTQLAAQSANTVIANNTSGSASPTAISTSSLFTGNNGQVLARSNGTWVGVATSTDSCSSGVTCSYSGGTNSFTIANNGLTLAMLPQISAGFILGNNTSSSANVTSFATSSLFGTGTGGQVLAWNNGVPQFVATTTFAGTAPISLSYAAGQVTGSCTTAASGVAGCLSSSAFDTFNNKQATISATWPIILTGTTLSFGGLGTTSNLAAGAAVLYATGVNTIASAATTSLTASGVLSLSNPVSVIGGSASALTVTGGSNGQALAWASGAPTWIATTSFSAGTGISLAQAGNSWTITNTGSTFAYPFGIQTNFGASRVASTTNGSGIWFQNGLYASTTLIADNATTTAATTTYLAISSVSGSTQCLQVNSTGVVSGTGSGCGTAVSPFSVITPYVGQEMIYPTTLTDDFLLGKSSSTTAPFWWDTSATTSYIGNGGSSNDSSIQTGPSGFEWTFGSKISDHTFKISSSTSLGTSDALSINKSTLTTTLSSLLTFASSTIGDSTQTGGLTISGGATTTGNLIVSGNLTSVGNQTGTVNVVYSASPTLTGTLTIATIRGGTGVAGTLNLEGSSSAAPTSGGITFNGGANVEYARLTYNGYWGIGTTTPQAAALSIASSTGPVLSISDGSLTSNQWAFSTRNGNFYLGTSSPSTFATSTLATLSILTGGNTGYIGLASSTPWTNLSVGTGGSIVVSENKLSTTTSMTIDWRAGNQQLIQKGSAGITLSFTNDIQGQSLILNICNPSGGAGGSITWPAGIIWPSQTAPTQTTTANRCDFYSFRASLATSTASALTIFGAQTAF